jgi:microcompartment protein CcmL/EutN
MLTLRIRDSCSSEVIGRLENVLKALLNTRKVSITKQMQYRWTKTTVKTQIKNKTKEQSKIVVAIYVEESGRHF